jgi:hypothetical protein
MAKTDTSGARIRCACGAIEGLLQEPAIATRARCYCKDCQAFARFLGEPRFVLDDRGGTDLIATLPRVVRFTRGTDRLRCMSLAPRGLLRWYCGECRTPIGNTPRDPKTSYVGIFRACLAGSAEEIDALFGTATLAINTKSAAAPVASSGFAMLGSMVRIIRNLLGARLRGTWKDNPFFLSGTSEPIVTPVGPAPA